MGLSMATSVPRIRSSTLQAICDLVMEEETIRIKRGLNSSMKVNGMGRPWMDCLVRSLESESSGSDGSGSSSTSAAGGGSNDGIGHVLKSLIYVAKFAESKQNGNGGGCASWPKSTGAHADRLRQEG